MTLPAPQAGMLNLPALESATVAHDPFDYLVVREFVRPDAAPAVLDDFPLIAEPGSFPVDRTTGGPAFQELIAELCSVGVQSLFARHFDLELGRLGQLVTVRARSGRKDGFVHTDSAWKAVTVLLYLNDRWSADGGCLRLLRGPDLERVAFEVKPEWGTLVAFRRSDRSYHGHKPFHGERRLIQLNWVTDPKMLDRELRRHAGAAAVKRWLGRLWPPWSHARNDADRDY